MPSAACTSISAFGANAEATLLQVGCYAVGNSVLIPPALGTDGNANRGIFRGPGYVNWDFSILKDWKLKERFDIQFRTELFNILNHPNFWNLTGVGSGSHFNTPQSGGPGTGEFGCSCATPDEATANPVYHGGGGPREGYPVAPRLICTCANDASHDIFDSVVSRVFSILRPLR